MFKPVASRRVRRDFIGPTDRPHFVRPRRFKKETTFYRAARSIRYYSGMEAASPALHGSARKKWSTVPDEILSVTHTVWPSYQE